MHIRRDGLLASARLSVNVHVDVGHPNVPRVIQKRNLELSLLGVVGENASKVPADGDMCSEIALHARHSHARVAKRGQKTDQVTESFPARAPQQNTSLPFCRFSVTCFTIISCWKQKRGALRKCPCVQDRRLLQPYRRRFRKQTERKPLVCRESAVAVQGLRTREWSKTGLSTNALEATHSHASHLACLDQRFRHLGGRLRRSDGEEMSPSLRKIVCCCELIFCLLHTIAVAEAPRAGHAIRPRPELQSLNFVSCAFRYQYGVRPEQLPTTARWRISARASRIGGRAYEARVRGWFGGSRRRREGRNAFRRSRLFASTADLGHQ